MVSLELGWTCGGRTAGDWASPDMPEATITRRVDRGGRDTRRYGRGLFLHHDTEDRLLALIRSERLRATAAVVADSPLPTHLRNSWSIPRVCRDHLRDNLRRRPLRGYGCAGHAACGRRPVGDHDGHHLHPRADCVIRPAEEGGGEPGKGARDVGAPARGGLATVAHARLAPSSR